MRAQLIDDRNATDSDISAGLLGASPECQEESEELRHEFVDEGRDPDRNLPIRGYQRFTVPEVIRHTQKLDLAQLKEILKYERAHRNRKTLIAQLLQIVGEEPSA